MPISCDVYGALVNSYALFIHDQLFCSATPERKMAYFKKNWNKALQSGSHGASRSAVRHECFSVVEQY